MVSWEWKGLLHVKYSYSPSCKVMGLDQILFEGPASADTLCFGDPKHRLPLSCISLELWTQFCNDHMLRTAPWESKADSCLVFCLPISCTCSSSLESVSCRSWRNLLFTLIISSMFENRTSRSPCGSWKERRSHRRSLGGQKSNLICRLWRTSRTLTPSGAHHSWEDCPSGMFQGLWHFIN